MAKEWKTISGYQVKETKFPGVLERRSGGYLLRARVLNKATGRLREIRRAVDVETPAEASAILEAEKQRIRKGESTESTGKRSKIRFAEYSLDLLERKIAARDIKSAVSRQTWGVNLKHLSLGVDKVKGLGSVYMHELTEARLLEWRQKVAIELIAKGKYSPKTCNGWLRDLRVVMRAASRELRIPDAIGNVKSFDESEHETYSDEEPNALTPEEVPKFLQAMKEMYPQFYAMVFLGFTTGLRPSSMRPLRRKGEKPDILWDQSIILVRRSQTVGDEVMNITKQKTRYKIAAHQDLMNVLRWHVDTQLDRPEMVDSELMFPSITGGYRSPTVLNKPFKEVALAVDLGKKVSQRCMRRTFQDLARKANVHDLVTRSISGHATDEMHRHYSTVNQDEQRSAMGKVIQLFGATGVKSGAR